MIRQTETRRHLKSIVERSFDSRRLVRREMYKGKRERIKLTDNGI